MPVSLQNDFKALETKADNQAGNERIRTICLCEDEPTFLYLSTRQTGTDCVRSAAPNGPCSSEDFDSS